VLTVAVETIGDGLSDPGKDCREVEHEELGVEILLHGVGAEAGEVLDFEAAFLTLPQRRWYLHMSRFFPKTDSSSW